MTETAPPATGRPDRAPGGPSGWLRNPFLWAFLLGIVTLTLLRPLLRHEPAPPPVLGELPRFSLTDADGRAFGNADLAGRVHVVNFIFTRCASICPRLTAAMARLQERYAAERVEGVRLLSITVDPEFDTPRVLKAYGESHGVDPGRWSFLTGSLEEVTALVVGGFKTAVGERTETAPELIDIAHSAKFVLVDGAGRIRGYFDSDDLGLDEIFHRSQHVLAEQD